MTPQPVTALNPDVVLLDLDGTINDSHPGIYRCLRHALPSIGLQDLTDEQVQAFLGPPLHYTLGEVHGIPKDQIEVFVKEYRSVYFGGGEYEFELYPGMEQLIRDIAASDTILLLATAKPIESAERVLTHAGLIEHFDGIGGSDLDLTRQDKPSIITYAFGLVDRDPASSNAVFVGDRKEDILGAKHHGITTIGAAWGYGEEGELEEAGADYIVANAEELRALLLGA